MWLWIAGVPVLLVVLLLGVGMALPASHTASMTLDVAAPRERVWALIADVTHTNQWRPDITAITDVSSSPVRWTEVSSFGKTPFTLVEATAPSHQVTRVIDDGLPFGGTWTWRLDAQGTGTRVTITEAGVIRSAFFRIMSRIAFPPTKTMDGYLRALAAALGERAVPVIVRAR
ncbi:MAG: SRPBCC family protein [Gemmatimonadaceae bacterium]|jgi:uncharacterized protein YndB with AHSA1/START domain|nr:SRPBCC family protein [Gemmatimonadaceae bacterium]